MDNGYNIAIIGGGVLGCALARSLALQQLGASPWHASERNSGVVHSGFHLKPGFLKAKLCVEGSRRIADYCIKRGIP